MADAVWTLNDRLARLGLPLLNREHVERKKGWRRDVYIVNWGPTLGGNGSTLFSIANLPEYNTKMAKLSGQEIRRKINQIYHNSLPDKEKQYYAAKTAAIRGGDLNVLWEVLDAHSGTNSAATFPPQAKPPSKATLGVPSPATVPPHQVTSPSKVTLTDEERNMDFQGRLDTMSNGTFPQSIWNVNGAQRNQKIKLWCSQRFTTNGWTLFALRKAPVYAGLPHAEKSRISARLWASEQYALLGPMEKEAYMTATAKLQGGTYDVFVKIVHLVLGPVAAASVQSPPSMEGQAPGVGSNGEQANISRVRPQAVAVPTVAITPDPPAWNLKVLPNGTAVREQPIPAGTTYVSAPMSTTSEINQSPHSDTSDVKSHNGPGIASSAVTTSPATVAYGGKVLPNGMVLRKQPVTGGATHASASISTSNGIDQSPLPDITITPRSSPLTTAVSPIIKSSAPPPSERKVRPSRSSATMRAIVPGASQTSKSVYPSHISPLPVRDTVDIKANDVPEGASKPTEEDFAAFTSSITKVLGRGRSATESERVKSMLGRVLNDAVNQELGATKPVKANAPTPIGHSEAPRAIPVQVMEKRVDNPIAAATTQPDDAKLANTWKTVYKHLMPVSQSNAGQVVVALTATIRMRCQDLGTQYGEADGINVSELIHNIVQHFETQFKQCFKCGQMRGDSIEDRIDECLREFDDAIEEATAMIG